MQETPHLVAGIAELPPLLRTAALQVLPPDATPRVTLLIPPHIQTLRSRRRSAPLQAVSFTETGILHVQAGVSATYLHSADIRQIRHWLILLYGGLEVTGRVKDKPVHLLVEYNTVAEPLFHTALQDLLRQVYGAGPLPERRDAVTEHYLQQLRIESFKFQSGLRHYALLPTERLRGYVWQPRLSQRLLGVIPRALAPAGLLALTEWAILLLQEEKRRGASYGWMLSFCPRRYIESVELDARRGALIIRLRDIGDALTVRLGPEQARMWAALWAARDVAL